MNKFLKYASLFLLFYVFTTSIFSGEIKGFYHNGQRYIYLEGLARYYGMKVFLDSKTYILSGRGNRITFETNSKVGSINGVMVYYSYPLDFYRGKPIINGKDFLLFIDPILNNHDIRKHRLQTIVIDPGHGAQDTGARGRYSKEKTIALAIARELAHYLSSQGYRVIMTRNRDVFIPLKERPAVCDRFGGDLYVSIHCNSSPDSFIKGTETFLYTPAGTCSTYAGEGEKAKSENGNRYDKNNARLAYEIQKSLKNAGRDDRGVKHAKFAVLKYCDKPAVLVETGFISSPTEENLLNTRTFQKQIASAIGRGIISYHRALISRY